MRTKLSIWNSRGHSIQLSKRSSMVSLNVNPSMSTTSTSAPCPPREVRFVPTIADYVPRCMSLIMTLVSFVHSQWIHRPCLSLDGPSDEQVRDRRFHQQVVESTTCRNQAVSRKLELEESASISPYVVCTWRAGIGWPGGRTTLPLVAISACSLGRTLTIARRLSAKTSSSKVLGSLPM